MSMGDCHKHVPHAVHVRDGPLHYSRVTRQQRVQFAFRISSKAFQIPFKSHSKHATEVTGVPPPTSFSTWHNFGIPWGRSVSKMKQDHPGFSHFPPGGMVFRKTNPAQRRGVAIFLGRFFGLVANREKHDDSGVSVFVSTLLLQVKNKENQDKNQTQNTRQPQP